MAAGAAGDFRVTRRQRAVATVLLLTCLAACGGGGGVTSTPTPVNTTPVTPVTPTPTSFDTSEYRRSNGAVQAQAITAYQAGASGAGVIAAVIDSGVDPTSAEFAGRISPFSGDAAGNRGVSDEDGHGTQVSALLLAARNGSSIQGVAWGATLLSIRTDRPGSCAATDGCGFGNTAIASGIDTATSVGARVINLSLGGNAASPTLVAAISRATSAGIVIVIAAGNEKGSEIDPLAASAIAAAAPGTVIVAGAVDENNVMADFSNHAGAAGASYLTALGVKVRSFDHTGTAYLYSGTSESAPIIAGAVALLAQAFPNLTGKQIVELLLRTADDLGDAGVDAVYGHGALNLARAFAPVGTLSVAKVADPLSLAGAGSLGGPLGDAGQTGAALAKVPAHDSYDRAYLINVAGLLTREPVGRLAASLFGDTVRSSAGRVGSLGFAVATRGGDGLAWRGEAMTGVQDRRDPGQLLTGQAQVALAPDRTAVFGFGQSLGALLDSAGGQGALGLAPLVTGRSDGLGVLAHDRAGAAVAQRLGAWTASFGIGELRLGEPLRPGQPLPGLATASRAVLRLERDIGRLHIAGSGELLVERGALLGSRLAPAFGLNGASTASAVLQLVLPLGGWSLAGEARLAHSSADFSGAGLIRHAEGLVGTAGSLTLVHGGIIVPGDMVSASIAQPLRVSGRAELAFGDGGLTGFGPSGREIAAEAQYARPLWGGTFGFGLFWRHQPGHILDAAPDAGGAIRFRLGI